MHQELRGCAPALPGQWPFMNTLSDDELRADLEVAHALRDQYGTSTTEGAIRGGTIGGWIAQALRVRPRLLVPSRVDLGLEL